MINNNWWTGEKIRKAYRRLAGTICSICFATHTRSGCHKALVRGKRWKSLLRWTIWRELQASLCQAIRQKSFILIFILIAALRASIEHFAVPLWLTNRSPQSAGRIDASRPLRVSLAVYRSVSFDLYHSALSIIHRVSFAVYHPLRIIRCVSSA